MTWLALDPEARFLRLPASWHDLLERPGRHGLLVRLG